MDDVRVERVLRCAECVPPGRVAPYSMLGRITGESARAVGRVMSLYGSNVAWWRVTNVAGALPAELLARALPHWDAEALPHTGAGADIARCLADEGELRARWRARVADLDEVADAAGPAEEREHEDANRDGTRSSAASARLGPKPQRRPER